MLRTTLSGTLMAGKPLFSCRMMQAIAAFSAVHVGMSHVTCGRSSNSCVTGSVLRLSSASPAANLQLKISLSLCHCALCPDKVQAIALNPSASRLPSILLGCLWALCIADAVRSLLYTACHTRQMLAVIQHMVSVNICHCHKTSSRCQC